MKFDNPKLTGLWIAPNLNHYKQQFMERLSDKGKIEIHYLSGILPENDGFIAEKNAPRFRSLVLNVKKYVFPFHPKVYWTILSWVFKHKYDFLNMPVGIKFLPLILWVRFLSLFRDFRLATYCHPYVRASKGPVTVKELNRTRRFYKLFDIVIFYTQHARDWALEQNLLPEAKASFANNTLDTKLIESHYSFAVNRHRPFRILFIARLVKTKRVDLLLRYFDSLQEHFPDLELTLIGDGPDRFYVETALKGRGGITWLGSVIDEAIIAEEMTKAHLVFIPGETGLSVVHAFAYGKPYLTLNSDSLAHGPEIAYLKDGENGLFMGEDFSENINQIQKLLTNKASYTKMCERAYETAKSLSVDHWCEQTEFSYNKLMSHKFLSS